MLGWALPSRPGATPSTNAFWAWLTSTDSVDSKIDTSTRWPVPWAGDEGSSRPASAARIPTAAWSPVATSAIATPTFVGPPPSASVAPVIDISPASAWRRKS